MTYTDLPPIYTAFNAAATVGIVLGLVFIKNGMKRPHIVSMSFALLMSTAFLACYLVYHYKAGHVEFAGQGMVRTVYFLLLIPHIILAIVSLPMIIMTVVPALRSRFDKHKRMAKWTVPVWLYVSVTGVIVYYMNYVWYVK